MSHLAASRPGLLCATILITAAFCIGNATAGDKLESLDPRLPGFVKTKEAQARAIARNLGIKVSPDVWRGFELFARADWLAASNHFQRLVQRNAQYAGSSNDKTVGTPAWQPLMEVELVMAEFCAGEPSLARAFGDGVIASIPRGSIYFGGTDPGRGLPTGLVRSHAEGDPFFVLTQNALADRNYIDYLRQAHGKRISLPSDEDLQTAFETYLIDAQQRLKDNKLKPGEDVRIVDNRVQVSGQVAVMALNALLAEMIFEQNTNREFYVEESFPLEWMYPHLVPHDLIMKVERNPPETLPDSAVRRDEAFWTRYCAKLIGDWLTADTSIQEIASFADRVYRRNNLSGFTGDPAFARSDRARKAFSKLRVSQGGVYAWRLQRAKTETERERMAKAVDFAFRQALALCPSSPEAVFRYANLLVSKDRIDDALQVAQLALTFGEQEHKAALDGLIASLQQMKRQQSGGKGSQPVRK